MALTIGAALQLSSQLEDTSDSARLDAEVLLATLLGRDRSYLYTWPERRLSDEQHQQFQHYMSQRRRGVPVAYIIGEREFWSLTLAVDTSTLIPRPDTERLVELALDRYKDTEQPRTVIDLGTGTGAIALALASECPRWQLLAIDRSMQACALAEKNRRRYDFENVVVTQGDWLCGIDELSADMIVSNPPYIDQDDQHLNQGDVRFEPRSALVASNHGLSDIELIAQQALGKLKPEGWLLLEHGYQQGALVRECLQQKGYSAVITEQDMGGQDRVTLGQKPKVAPC